MCDCFGCRFQEALEQVKELEKDQEDHLSDEEQLEIQQELYDPSSDSAEVG